MNINRYNNEFVRNNLDETDVLLQLAEEAGELAQAAAKKARILLNNNPTPVTPHQADVNLLGEFADVLVCYSILFANSKDKQVMSEAKRKLERWVTRLGGISHHTSTAEERSYYYTKDNVAITAGSTYFGEKDGEAWTVVGFVPGNKPYVVKAKNDKLGIKELKPRWLVSKSFDHNSPDNVSKHDVLCCDTELMYKLNEKSSADDVLPLVYRQD